MVVGGNIGSKMAMKKAAQPQPVVDKRPVPRAVAEKRPVPTKPTEPLPHAAVEAVCRLDTALYRLSRKLGVPATELDSKWLAAVAGPHSPPTNDAAGHAFKDPDFGELNAKGSWNWLKNEIDGVVAELQGALKDGEGSDPTVRALLLLEAARWTRKLAGSMTEAVLKWSEKLLEAKPSIARVLLSQLRLVLTLLGMLRGGGAANGSLAATLAAKLLGGRAMAQLNVQVKDEEADALEDIRLDLTKQVFNKPTQVLRAAKALSKVKTWLTNAPKNRSVGAEHVDVVASMVWPVLAVLPRFRTLSNWSWDAWATLLEAASELLLLLVPTDASTTVVEGVAVPAPAATAASPDLQLAVAALTALAQAGKPSEEDEAKAALKGAGLFDAARGRAATRVKALQALLSGDGIERAVAAARHDEDEDVDEEEKKQQVASVRQAVQLLLSRAEAQVARKGGGGGGGGGRRRRSGTAAAASKPQRRRTNVGAAAATFMATSRRDTTGVKAAITTLKSKLANNPGAMSQLEKLRKSRARGTGMNALNKLKGALAEEEKGDAAIREALKTLEQWIGGRPAAASRRGGGSEDGDVPGSIQMVTEVHARAAPFKRLVEAHVADLLVREPELQSLAVLRRAASVSEQRLTLPGAAALVAAAADRSRGDGDGDGNGPAAATIRPIDVQAAHRVLGLLGRGGTVEVSGRGIMLNNVRAVLEAAAVAVDPSMPAFMSGGKRTAASTAALGKAVRLLLTAAAAVAAGAAARDLSVKALITSGEPSLKDTVVVALQTTLDKLLATDGPSKQMILLADATAKSLQALGKRPGTRHHQGIREALMEFKLSEREYKTAAAKLAPEALLQPPARPLISFSHDALRALDAIEMGYVMELLQDSHHAAQHATRVTVGPPDVDLVMKLRRRLWEAGPAAPLVERDV